MADTTALKNRIRAAIKANDNQEITGPVLQQALLDMVDELNGATETEASARQNGDSTLQQGINTERQQRQDADTALGQRITDEIRQEAQAREDAFDKLDLIDAAGSQVTPEAIDLTLKKNDGSEEDPEWRTLCHLLIPSATNQRAGLMSVAMRNLLYNLRNAGYAFGGIAVTATNPGVPSGNCFYIVRGAGTYTHFKNADNESIVLENDGIYVLTYESVENNYWEYNLIVGIDAIPTAGSDNLVKSSGVHEEVSQLGQLLPNIASKYSIQTNYWYGENYLHWVIPVNGGETVSFTLASGVTGYFAYLTSYETPIAGETPSFVSGYEGRQSVTGSFVIPTGTKYLIVNQPDQMGYTSLKINGIEFIGGVYTALFNIGLIIKEVSDDATEKYNIVRDNNAYAICYTGASIAAKAIATDSLPALTKSKDLHVLVKFINQNTTDNVTLSTPIGTYPLYYHGQQASSANSWQEGEILDIRFDVTDNIWYAESWDKNLGEKDRNDIITSIITQKLLLRPGYCQTTFWRMNSSDAHILIPVNPGDIVRWSGDSYTNYYILLTDYITPVAGATPSFVTGYEGRQVFSSETKQLTIPDTCKYIALTCDLLTLSRLTSLSVNGFNLLDGWGQYIEQIAKGAAGAISDSDLTMEITSNNLANPDNIGGGLVDNVGRVSFAPISPSDTWRVIMIPLSADDAGRNITFGGFYLGRNGYCAFYNGDTLMSFYQNFDPNGTQNPTTLTIPSNCDRLYIDIMSSSSPYELDNNYTYLMVNFGDTLLDYDEFETKITKINNIKLAGASVELENRVTELEGDVENLEDRVTELEANVVDFVVADLPVSDGADIQSGYAYIDSTTRYVKVKA